MTTETHTEGNSEFLKNWKNFQRHFKGAGSILLPISFDIKDGKIVRNRITAKELSSLRTELINDFEAHYKTVNDEIAEDYSVSEFKTMLDEYIKWFEGGGTSNITEGSIDDSQKTTRKNPLDLTIERPVWILFHTANKHWTFSEHRQFSVENDRNDHSRNCVKICTLMKNKMFLMKNRWRVAPLVMKYNLHVTITQQENGKDLYTDIIIDPGMNNDLPP